MKGRGRKQAGDGVGKEGETERGRKRGAWREGRKGSIFFYFLLEKSDKTSQITPSSRNSIFSLGEGRPCPNLPGHVGSTAVLMKEAFGMLTLGIN